MLLKTAIIFVVPYFEVGKRRIDGLIETMKNAVKGKWEQFKVLTCTFSLIH